MTRRKPQPILNQEALEDRILIDLFHNRRATGRDMKRLADYTGENEWRVLAHLAKQGDVVFVGDGQVIISYQGLRRITEKHPELKTEGVVKDKEPGNHLHKPDLFPLRQQQSGTVGSIMHQARHPGLCNNIVSPCNPTRYTGDLKPSVY